MKSNADLNHKKKISKIILYFSFGLVAIMGYFLADRYLIRHVQIENVTAYSETLAVENVADRQTSTSTIDADVTSTVEPEQTIFDEWNYKSDSLSISIAQYSSGSGKTALTYYVADVIISDVSQLANAFADNQFGTNIIQTTSEIANENAAIFAINGDYYGFREDGIIIRNGVVYRDNPARTGLAFYFDGTMKIYDETQTSAQELIETGVWNTYSFGPALITDGVAETNFEVVNIDHNIGNHPISGNQPRTGIGMIDANHFVFIVVDGRSEGYSTGVTLDEFAQLFKDLGCTQAYNLDGGGSSTMYFMGRVVNNPLGRNKERGTSDILMIGSD